MKRLIALLMCIAMVFTMTACAMLQGPKGDKGDPGKDGKDGVSPTITISDDGYWVINGLKSAYKAVGTDGIDGTSPTIEISADGYWIINGTKTEYKAIGKDGTDGKPGTDGTTPTIAISDDGYWVINGVKTDHKAIGKDGVDGTDGKPGNDGTTPTIAISEDGYWVINGVKTNHKAIGTDGKDGIDGTDGKPGTDGTTPTIEISADGYWVINGVKTEFKSCTCTECEHSYTTVVVAPTCVLDGYTEHTCTKCDKAYKDNETSATGIHSYRELYVLESTCISKKVLKTCTVCNALTVDDETPTVPHNYVDGFCTVCGKAEPAYTIDGDYVYFGEYPQTIKADDVTVTDTTDSRGYYLGSDGEYYAAVTADPYGSNYTFTNNTTVVSGTVYYFKVEPIRWRILSTDGETALILCDSIIANMAYQPDYTYDSASDRYYTTANGAPDGTYVNNYKYSEVRRWLNDNFYNTAFTALEQELIITTQVDNSAESLYNYGSTGSFSSTYACEDTYDKVFLLSRQEATNPEYGFASSGTNDTARRMQTSDYSRATGAYMHTSESYFGNSWWWLRSPDYGYCSLARAISSDGSVYYYGNVCYSHGGVVPALQIML